MNSEYNANHRITIIVPFHKLTGTEQFFNWVSDLDKYQAVKVIVAIDSDDETIYETLSNLNICNMKLVQKKVGAPGLARNLALTNIQSEYVMFADSDDFVYLDNILRILSKSLQSDLIIASYEKYNWKTKKVTKHKYPTNEIEFAIEPGLWRLIFRTSDIIDLKFTEFRMAEDQLFILQYFINQKTITSTGEVIYQYWTQTKHQVTNEETALSQLRCAIDYLELHDDLISTTMGSFVYAKLNLSLGVVGIKKLCSKNFSFVKVLKLVGQTLKMKLVREFDAQDEFQWSNNG